MTLAELSIKRPIFITCVVTLIIVLGVMSMQKLPVDLFPNVNFPVVSVITAYPGAGPAEVEMQVSKVFEDALSTVSGLKRISSDSKEGVSVVIAEFTLETDIKYAEQQVRDKVSFAKIKLPDDVKESIIRRMDPADQPVGIITVTADLPPGALFELADEVIRPRVEQITDVGLVEVIGGRKREVRVELDRKKLRAFELSAQQVSARIKASGVNIPAGKVTSPTTDTSFRTLGEFRTLKDIEDTVVNFVGNDVPVKVSDVARVVDSLEDEKSRTFYNGKQSLFLMVFRRTGANTIRVLDGLRKTAAKLDSELKDKPGAPSLMIVQDRSKAIRANVDDVRESIFIGIVLTILVVFFFLGSGRSTIITSLALPNSLLGAFILMDYAGFSINMMTLLALSLSVGLLIDDAIVVRENIFRLIEKGVSPIQAASLGTKEVALAVIATTLAVISVFGPVAFLEGIVGQFFREFGLTICFAMAISLFDAMTVAPMLSAYFAGANHGIPTTGFYGRTVGSVLRAFNRLQDGLENVYEKVLQTIVGFSMVKTFVGVVAFFAGMVVLVILAFKFTPSTFLSPQDTGEFSVGLELPPGTSLEAMSQVALEVDARLRKNPEVASSVLTVGSRDFETNKANFTVELVSSKKRSVNTSQFKDLLRAQLKDLAHAKPTVKDIDMVGGGMRPFNVNITGQDLKQIEAMALKLYDKLKAHPGVHDPELSFSPGKPEFQVALDPVRSEQLGVSTAQAGLELRNLIEGAVPAVFRERGLEYDIRVRLQDDQRNLKAGFAETLIPNLNFRLVKLDGVATGVETTGPSLISRVDRSRAVKIGADIAPKGPGMSTVITDTSAFLKGDAGMPAGTTFFFAGQAESFQEMGVSMVKAIILATIFTYLVLASLYESFVTPFTIMLVLPLAISGAFFALFITRQSHDLNSWIGCILLLGVASKNSILLVDCTNQLMSEGMERTKAIVQGGKTRLRPILMTTFALISGMLPVAIGLNEASKQRTSMGIAVIGGLISSTILSLVVIPACFSFIDEFRVRAKAFFKRVVSGVPSPAPSDR